MDDLTICHLLTRGTDPYKLYIKLSSLLHVGMSDTNYYEKLGKLMRLTAREGILQKRSTILVDAIRSSKEYKDRINRVKTYIDKLPRDQEFFTFRLMDIVRVFRKFIDINTEYESFFENEYTDVAMWIASTTTLYSQRICDMRITLNYTEATSDALTEYMDSIGALEQREAIFDIVGGLIEYLEENGMVTGATVTDELISSDVDVSIARASITDGMDVYINDLINAMSAFDFIEVAMSKEWEPYVDIEFKCPIRNSDGEVSIYALLELALNDEDTKRILRDISTTTMLYSNMISVFDDPNIIPPDEKQIKKDVLKAINSNDYAVPITYIWCSADPVQRFQSYVERQKDTDEYDHRRIYEMLLEHKSPEMICDAIDKIIDTVLPECKIQPIGNILSRLHMLFMVDDYPVGAKFDKKGTLVYVCKRIVERIQRLANFEVSSRFIVAKRNYKASIMRNTALGYAYTKYLLFSDDDDIGCSIVELVNREINGNPNHDNFAVFPITSASIRFYPLLCGMWRYVINVPLARLLCFNNPPFLMTGEDAVTVKFFEHQVFKSIVDLNQSTSKGKVGYIYMDASNRYTDLFIQYVERIMFNRIFMRLLSLTPSDFEMDEKDVTLDNNVIKPKAREHILNGIGVRAELIEAVNEFTIFDTLNSDPDSKPYFAFATQRPSVDEVNARPSTFPFTVIPREARIDHDTGIVYYNDKTYSAKEWNTFLKNYVASSVKKDSLTIAFDNLIRGKEDLFEDINPDDLTFPRLRTFGGNAIKSSTFKIFILIIICIVVIAIVCIVVIMPKIKARTDSTKDTSE